MPRSPLKNQIPTRQQVSAGGVVYRETRGQTEVALICVAPEMRWQLPKGHVDKGELPEEAAIREVREETGIDAEIIGEIETIEYWYFSGKPDKRVRLHKFVHFYLMKFLSGNTDDHDDEVEEARLVPIDKAITMLSFQSERTLVEKALKMLSLSAKK